MPFVAQKERRLLEAAQRDHTPEVYFDDLQEAIDSRAYVAEDFRIREVFENFVDGGHELAQTWAPGASGRVNLTEAGVNTGNFANIMSNVIHSKVMERWNMPGFIADQLCETVPTNLNGEMLPGVGGIGDEAEEVSESHGYPTAGFGEFWVETPRTQKWGFIVPVTKEAIYFDRTGLVLSTAQSVVDWLRVHKEKRVIDAATGQTDLYRRNGAAAVASYGDNAGAHNWDNLAASNALVDWTDVENAQLLMEDLIDPETGEPVVVNGVPQILIPGALNYTARRVFNATEFRYVSTHTTISANPLAGQPLDIVTNQWVKARTSSASTWFYGDFKGAFKYMENWPIAAETAPPNSELEFTHDIAHRSKVSERGVIACVEPRKVVKCTA